MQSLVLGAPRHQHTGKVIIFTQSPKQWTPQAEVTGTQVGVEGARADHEGGQGGPGAEKEKAKALESWGRVRVQGDR